MRASSNMSISGLSSGPWRPPPPPANIESVESIIELQKMLADERERAVEHKMHYGLLKEEHGRLRERYEQMERERRLEREEARDAAMRLERRLEDTRDETEALRMNQATEGRIGIIRMKIEEQFESVYQERLSRCSAECDAMRVEMGRMKTENSFLKAEYEHQCKEHSRIIEEINLIHQSEVTSLKNEKARLLASSIEIPQESGNLKELSKENGILRGQLKSLSNELQETRGKMEHDKTNVEQELRAKKKQLSDMTSTCRKLELEIESLKKQLLNNQKELSSWNTENASLQFNVSELDRTNRSLQNRLDELTQKTKVDLTQLKLESAKQKCDIENQKDLLAARIEELEYQLRLAGTKCGQLENQLQEREVSIARREAAIKETEWARVQQLENEKLELENQIGIFQSSLREEKNSVSTKMNSLEERARNAEQKERTADKERESMKHKLEISATELKNLKSTLNESKNKLIHQEAELDECYNRLAMSELIKKEKSELEQQTKDLTKQLAEISSNHEGMMSDKTAQAVQDRTRFQQRIKELEEELSKSLEKTRLLQDELRRKNKKHCNYFNKQKKQLQITTALKEEMQAEIEILKRNVPAEEYQRLNRELKDLRRRHQEYKTIIMQSEQSGQVSNHVPLHESRYEQSLEQLKRRMEILDEKQQQQLPEVLEFQETEKGDLEKPQTIFGPRGDNI